jgi:hypothetical protein
MSALSIPSLQFELLIPLNEFPETLSLLKQKLFRYGIFINPDDRILIEDIIGDRIAIDEELFSKYIDVTKIKSKIKLVLLKYESLDKEENKVDLLNSSSDMLLNLSAIDQYKYPQYCDNSDNLVINESIILNRQDNCLQTVFRKYLTDMNTLINNQEKELSSYLLFENFHEFKDQFSLDEIKAARDIVIPFHNLLVYIADKSEHRFKEAKNSLTIIHEMYRQKEITYMDLEKKLKYYISLFEKDQAIFNKFMLELNQHIYDFEFDFGNHNFNASGFENNLCNVFSFIIKSIHYFNSQNLEFPIKLKTEKYKMIETKCVHMLKGNSFCLCDIRFLNPDYWKNTIYNRTVYEDLLRKEQLYEV